MPPKRRLQINKNHNIKMKNILVRDFLKYKSKTNKNIVETKNVLIKKLGENKLDTNYYLLKCKDGNKNCFFVKEVKNKFLLEKGNHGYNEYLALQNREFKKIINSFGFEVIEPYLGFIDHKKNISFIVTPYKEKLKTIDQAFSEKLINKKQYLNYRNIFKNIQKKLKEEKIQIGDLQTHNVLIDPKNKKQKPIVIDPWYIPKPKIEN
jgi:hypothetical protein